MKEYRWRFLVVVGFLSVLLLLSVGRMVMLSVVKRDFLVKQGNARVLRVVDIPAHRGMITDRFGQTLALSTVVNSVWVDPPKVVATSEQLAELGKLLKIPSSKLSQRIRAYADKHFVYLKRGLPPSVGEQIESLNLPGVFLQKDYRRYYPEGPVTAHVLGFTNVDDHGQEGLELSLENILKGAVGKKLVLKDRVGYVVEELKVLKEPHEGESIALSLDHRIQYLAYRELSQVVSESHAQSGSAVVLDVNTGEILAMVNTPSYNPNADEKSRKTGYKNLAVTDTFEPGSTIKPFSILAALESKKYQPETMIDTNPGWMSIGGYVIQEHDRNYGVISLADVLANSSNVGVARVVLTLPEQLLSVLLQQLGFGQLTASGFPGEVPGKLPIRSHWRPVELASLSFGYSLSVTALQLAQAYAVLAAGGIKRPVTFLRQTGPVEGERVVDAHLAETLIQLLQGVVNHGTGTKAKIPGYAVAGKTGTAYIAGAHGYQEGSRRYTSSFIGIVPADRPRLVIAVVITDPKGKQHYGGQVGTPVFKKIAMGALRWLEVPPHLEAK